MNRYIFVYLQHISNSVELCICITMTYEKNKWDISLNSSETLLSLFMFSYKQRPIMIIYFHNFYKQVFSLQIYSNVTSFSHPGYQNLKTSLKSSKHLFKKISRKSSIVKSFSGLGKQDIKLPMRSHVEAKQG